MGGISPRRFPSPLRYPGGKGKVANYIKLVMMRNGLVGSNYIEPYAGGAGVALSLLFEEYASHIHINDLDHGVSAFWRAVVENTEDLCERVLKTRPTMAEWRRQKGVLEASASKTVDVFDLAFATFFLNRTNRSGIIHGGPIGGVKQNGPWGLDARYNRQDLVRRIRKIARFRSRIAVSGEDARTILGSREREAERSLTYLDPPYYSRGAELYTNYYGDEDHVEIAKLVKRLKGPWLVSYDSTPEVDDLFSGYRSVKYSLSYSAADRYRGTEVMFFSPDLEAPKVASPANIRASVVEAELSRAI